MSTGLLSASFIVSLAIAAVPNLVTDQAGVFSFLNRREHWERSEVLWTDVALAPGKATRAYFSKLACGRGVCPQYLFLKTNEGRWRLIGVLPAQFERTEESKNGFRILRTNSFIGEPEEGIEQSFGYDGETYVPQ